MPVVHFTTELSGGAGSVVRNLHAAMLDAGIPSLVLSREPNSLSNTKVIKPTTRVDLSVRSRWRWILGKLGYTKSSYAMFGIERCPVNVGDIQNALDNEEKPSAFIFYWISRFVNLETICELSRAYPNVPFVFVPLDEALLTGGCHYSNGCLRYHENCKDCPATSFNHLKAKIERDYLHGRDLVLNIDPFVIYSTSNIQRMGQRSAALKNARSRVMPLGAVSKRELNLAKQNSWRDVKEGKVTLLIRSSSEYRKGCDMFVSAIKVMSAERPDLRARLKVISIGDAALKDARIDKYVDHIDMGFVEREELISIYLKVDAFVMTSREEGGPLMINECVALGVFVISTPVGVANDLIIHKKNGLVAKDVSSESIGASLMEFLVNYEVFCDRRNDSVDLKVVRSSLTFEGYVQTLIDTIYRSS